MNKNYLQIYNVEDGHPPNNVMSHSSFQKHCILTMQVQKLLGSNDRFYY